MTTSIDFNVSNTFVNLTDLSAYPLLPINRGAWEVPTWVRVINNKADVSLNARVVIDWVDKLLKIYESGNAYHLTADEVSKRAVKGEWSQLDADGYAVSAPVQTASISSDWQITVSSAKVSEFLKSLGLNVNINFGS